MESQAFLPEDGPVCSVSPALAAAVVEVNFHYPALAANTPADPIPGQRVVALPNRLVLDPFPTVITCQHYVDKVVVWLRLIAGPSSRLAHWFVSAD